MMNDSGLDYGNFQIGAACIYNPSFIQEDLPANATINDLIAYANNYLACQCEGTCGNYDPVMSELTGIFLGFNSRFNECYVPDPCYLADENPEVSEFDFGLEYENIYQKKSLVLFPNPTERILNLKIEDDFQAMQTIEIYNFNGKKISEQKVEAGFENLIQLDLKNYPVGVYWVMVNMVDGSQVVEKFLIAK